jgi:cell wall-associated NlpC family hydrolase
MFISPRRGRRDAGGILSAARVSAFTIAFVCLALVAVHLAVTAPTAMAEEQPPTVRMHGATGGEGETAEGDDPFLRVDGREVDYPEPEPPPPPPGEAVVSMAMAYLGYPYVAGGTSPYGFDCSGFAYWVILNALGIDIGPALTGQPGMGAWVDYGAWLPGDLVFFQNTYQAGLSHVGIYLGNGLFIHAENESTGVTISSIYSEYYGPRYWGAVRVA